MTNARHDTRSDRLADSRVSRVARRDPRADPDDEPVTGRVDVVAVERPSDSPGATLRRELARLEHAAARVPELERALERGDAELASVRAELGQRESALEAAAGARDLAEARAALAERDAAEAREALAQLEHELAVARAELLTRAELLSGAGQLRDDLVAAIERWRAETRALLDR